MKKLLITTTAVITIFSTNSWAKPGGWIKDFLNNRSSSCGNYYRPVPVYYHEPVYYYQPRVVYYTTPQNIPMQPYLHYRSRVDYQPFYRY